MKKNGLGKGLDSLIPDQAARATRSAKAPAAPAQAPPELSREDQILQIPVAKIKPNPDQPRSEFSHANLEELASSIRTRGILQPLIVAPLPGAAGTYQLIAGERRWRASQLVGLTSVPAIVREAAAQEQLELALIENIQRQNLNPIEEAHAYRRLIDEFGLTQEELAGRVGKSRPVVANTLRLLTLPSEVQKALIAGKISYSTGRVIAGLPESQRLKFFQKALAGGAPVRQLEGDARQSGGPGGRPARPRVRTTADPGLAAKEAQLQASLGTKVSIKGSAEKGQIVVDFYSAEDLAELIKQLS